ncbi:MAG: PqqD family protein [Eubacterium sp.]|nr:PqqD family protein [Eubacterium sp.]
MKNNNFLDYVFKINDNLSWTLSDSGEVTIAMENKGFTNRIAQKFFKKPAVSHISLTGMGSFIFPLIDGKKTVYEIGQLVKEEYKEKAEPLYERLSLFLKKLEECGFISVVSSSK